MYKVSISFRDGQEFHFKTCHRRKLKTLLEVCSADIVSAFTVQEVSHA